ncbi:MAG: hypothetical protein Q8P22_07515 [Chloroflexota bacterium]|nr:hypothetical protein [Chloroflexota bacterium]
MTNTLHRYGSPESAADDYIVFVMATKGVNDEGSEAKAREFLKVALEYRPVNLGGGSQGGLYRPTSRLNPFIAYFTSRRHAISPRVLMQEIEAPGHAAAVFDNREAFEEFVAAVKKMDLGLSVNASALVEDTRCACRKAGFQPHSVEYSLGFRGRTDRLPDGRVLELTTMCGHGMVSASYAQKMILMVKEGRVTPERASQYMAKFCSCGVFNPSRATRVLKEAQQGVPAPLGV